ncbi:MAG: M10 family metallopeptidase C-terminal domain-containing protein [bacterium]
MSESEPERSFRQYSVRISEKISNAHRPDIISVRDSGYTHTQAANLAIGHHGTLAAITTVQESNLFLSFLATDAALWSPNPSGTASFGPWIGLTQTPGSAEPDGGWTWDTGEAFSFSAWHPTQPDNFAADRFGIYFDYQGVIGWGDTINDSGSAGFGSVNSAAIEVLTSVRHLTGTNGHDLIWGGDIANKINSRGGNDLISSNKGNDNVNGGSGNDNIDGGEDNDTINGGSGNDKLYGSNGDDSLIGRSGDDTLLGGPGKDTLIGGDGDDQYYTGPGHDRIVFTTAADGRTHPLDWIRDFENVSDKIDMTAIDPIVGDPDVPLTFVTDGFSGVGQVWVAASDDRPPLTHQMIEVNLNDDPEPEMIFYVDSTSPLTAADFLF